MVQNDWNDMLAYWRSRNQGAARVDRKRDPDGLRNVCQSSITTVNRYYDRSQRRALRSLIEQLPTPRAGNRALDMGCGAGRWCRYLAERGFEVTGVDLQEDLIASNCQHDPHIRYHCSSIQDFKPGQSYDLVTSVTVLQHLPYREQESAVRRLATLLAPGGHVAILENISDRSSSLVFSRPAQGWIELFCSQGLSAKDVRGYDYSPTLRSYYAATTPLRHRYFRAGEDERMLPEVSPGRRPKDLRSYAWRLDRGLRIGASMADTVIEPMLISTQPKLSTGHCAILFGPHD